jgi:hypothetical protein
MPSMIHMDTHLHVNVCPNRRYDDEISLKLFETVRSFRYNELRSYERGDGCAKVD